MSTARQQLFLEGNIIKALASLALPIITGNVLQTAYQMTDAFWVGRVGAAAVAAVSVSFPVIFLVLALGLGLSMAGSTLVAQHAGAGRQNRVDHVAAQTMLMVMIASVILSALGFFIAPHLLVLMGVEPAVYHGALGFMRVSFMGTVFIFIFVMFQSLMRGVGHIRLPLIIVLGTVALNFALDPLFIFGWGPVAPHGVVGAAMATLITQAVAAVAGFCVLLRGRSGIHITRANLTPDFTYIKRAFLLGMPVSVELSAQAAGLIVMSFLVASFGTTVIAAYGVGANILQVVTIPAMGLSMAVSTLVGQNMGAGNLKRAAHITHLGAAAGFVLLLAAGGVAMGFAPGIVGFFIPHDVQVIGLGGRFIRIMALGWCFIGAQMCLVAAFRASGNMLVSMVIALVSQWVLRFPLAYVLSKHSTLGVDGLWWAYPISMVALGFITACWFARGGWQKNRLDAFERQTLKTTESALIEEGTRTGP